MRFPPCQGTSPKDGRSVREGTEQISQMAKGRFYAKEQISHMSEGSSGDPPSAVVASEGAAEGAPKPTALGAACVLRAPAIPDGGKAAGAGTGVCACTAAAIATSTLPTSWILLCRLPQRDLVPKVHHPLCTAIAQLLRRAAALPLLAPSCSFLTGRGGQSVGCYF